MLFVVLKRREEKKKRGIVMILAMIRLQYNTREFPHIDE